MIDSVVQVFKNIGFSLGSSRWLARSLVKHAGIPGSQNIRVLEVGAGHGNVTREIIKHLHRDSSLIAIEQDEIALENLRQLHGKNVEIIHGDVLEMSSYISEGSIDIVISTLPLGSIDRETVDKILSEIGKTLKKGGKFVQYQYWMANKKDVKKHFRMERIHLEPRNFSPAFIYITDKE